MSAIDALESLLGGVRRPGDFSVHGALALPMPLVQVDGVGPLSFPLPDAQATALVAAAELAPYGRGEQTVLDTSVRRVWQIDAARVRVGGKSWPASLERVLAEVARGLGCEGAPIRAELYKLLVYDAGGFFLSHRDSEKAPGMFGTLLVQMPSPHTGGELLVRHGSREACIDLSATDGSELGFAAFYADCEHEVRPVTSGHRLCLVFNLLRGVAGDAPPAGAPGYDAETAQAATCLGEAFSAEGAPPKLVWLLAHQYSQAELGFDALKGADAAVAGVLRRAAQAADCAVHLAVMHIEESGPAEVNYVPYRGRHRSYGYGFDDEDQEHYAGATYEIVEVSDRDRYLDHWAAADGEAPAYGRLPLGDGELLPEGALDDEPPGEDRLLEATGNEGVSFERAYRRAVLVLWPSARQVDVLLQAGIEAAMPALEAVLAAHGADAAALEMAGRIVDHWAQGQRPRHAAPREGPLRGRMVACLARFGPTPAAQRFMQGVLAPDYDGSENAALAEAAAAVLVPAALETLLGALVETAFLRCPRALCELLSLLDAATAIRASASHAGAVQHFAQALVAALPGLAHRPERSDVDWDLAYDDTAADASSCHALLSTLERRGMAAERTAAVGALIDAPQVFDPARVLPPALQALCEAQGGRIDSDAQRLRLWRHGSAFLLARSEFPPPAPTDWRQPVSLSCRCEHCLALESFALDRQLRLQRFRVRQDLRDHLSRQIDAHGLHMDRETERSGGTHTLVCRKTREGYRRQCRQHAEDVAAMRVLLALGGDAVPAKCARLAAAAARAPEAVDG
jgi:hypothetical protein